MSARLFNGTTDLINYGNVASLDGQSKLSISLWFMTATFRATDVHVVKLSADANNGFTLQQSADAFSGPSLNNDILFTIRNGGVFGGYTEAVGLAVDTWHHLAMVYDGTLTGDANRLKGWVNGIAQTLNFSTFPGVPATAAANAGGLCLGGADLAPETHWNGRLYLVGLWNIALTDSEVAILASGVAPCAIQPGSLQVFAPLDQGQSPEPNLGVGGGSGTVTGTTVVDGPVLAYSPRCDPSVVRLGAQGMM